MAKPVAVATTATTTSPVASSTTTSAPEPTTITTQPTTTTTAAPVEGSGDDFFEFSVAGDQAAVLDITYSGDSNFVVSTYDVNNESIDLLVNEIGAYQGRVPVNFFMGEEVAFLEITASGPWTAGSNPVGTTSCSSLVRRFGRAAHGPPENAVRASRWSALR